MSVALRKFPIILPVIAGESEQVEEVIEVKKRVKEEDETGKTTSKLITEQFLLRSVNVIGRIDKSWLAFFTERGIDFNGRLRHIYETAYKNDFQVRPFPEDILNVFSMPIDKIKAVVVGQDPYPGWCHQTKSPKANGFSFATNDPETPGSLQRIRVAIVNLTGQITIMDKQFPNNLLGWRSQGVFLLNNTPAVYVSDEEQTSPRLQSLLQTPKRIWEGITATICKEISLVNPDCHFILLGREAHYLSRVVSKSVQAPHPSMRSDLDFDGKCFMEVAGIDWSKM